MAEYFKDLTGIDPKKIVAPNASALDVVLGMQPCYVAIWGAVGSFFVYWTVKAFGKSCEAKTVEKKSRYWWEGVICLFIVGHAFYKYQRLDL